VDAGEPFTKADAKRVALRLLVVGAIRFSGHARDEMKNDGIIEADVVNALITALRTGPRCSPTAVTATSSRAATSAWPSRSASTAQQRSRS
jgi:hypothetical protein